MHSYFPPARLLAVTTIALCFITPATSADTNTDMLPSARHIAVTQNTDSGPVILAARRYAAFWNTGDERYAQLALANDFIDRTLPAGRVQGPTGPLQASKTFRAAIPDLTASIDDMVVAGDRVSVHLHFSGHFSGRFGDVQGSGQAIDFQAFDLYRVDDGRISENWHLEDNLTLMQQLGANAQTNKE